ncbi:hypothetical protein ACFQZ4_23995 [Catellatospora coxensis]|uniref:Rad52/22 family double-strand break repair protein n=1 Tax=Catellatospora coxensis TaxID=310354 RepID=A0A8J3PCN5_9ACTN|nr:hypothetical protein [Catellatospora coxensis]GIG10181.1 hypothetical protein Cco03nite_68810 [Catellatospora coxensis]
MNAPTMTADIAAKLREPFNPTEVGKLPRVWCKACRDSGPGKVCQQHRKIKCDVCKNNITDAHLHLDYVGHAEITDRLLQVDATWTWEPVAMTPEGLPLLDREGGLWIRLTVAGVTRMGYGDAEGKKGPSAIKEAIGDALRNAAMRFGVGLDLWGAKFERDAQSTGDEEAPAQQAGEQQERPATATRQRTGGNAAKAAKPVSGQPPQGARAEAKAEPKATEPAGASPTFEPRLDAINSAMTDETLRAMWLTIEPAVKEKDLTEDEAAVLRRAVNARKPLMAPCSEANRRHLYSLWSKAGYSDSRDDRLTYTSEVVHRTVPSWNELSVAEFRLLAATVQAFIDGPDRELAGAAA